MCVLVLYATDEGHCIVAETFGFKKIELVLDMQSPNDTSLYGYFHVNSWGMIVSAAWGIINPPALLHCTIRLCASSSHFLATSLHAYRDEWSGWWDLTCSVYFTLLGYLHNMGVGLSSWIQSFRLWIPFQISYYSSSMVVVPIFICLCVSQVAIEIVADMGDSVELLLFFEEPRVSWVSGATG